MARNDATFPTIRTEGALLPADLLSKIAAGDSALPGLDSAAFGLDKNERLSEYIASVWDGAKGLWTAFSAGRQRVRESETGVTETRTLWILPLLELLGYDVQYHAAAEVIDGRPFRISHRAGTDPQSPPIQIVSYKDALDTPIAIGDQSGPRRASPHSSLQDYLNRTDHLWGMVTNGKKLRLLRDNLRLSRAAYLEFDLEAMMEGSVYADFVLLALLLHRSRLPEPGQQPEDCLLEQWVEETEAQGTRALDELRRGVEQAIEALGKGLVDHPANDALRDALTSGNLELTEYYRQLLRLVYRFLFLLAAEDRDLLFAPGVKPEVRRRYLDWYGIGRLRELVAERRHADRYDDLWRSLQVTFQALRDETAARQLGLEPLGGGLFDSESCAQIESAQIANLPLLTAIRGLTFTEQNGRLQRINYRDMGVEELGSVYEGLLELQPRLSVTGAHPVFELAASGERKSTGSYYTNSGLVQELIRSALDPVIAERLAAAPTPEAKRAALLALNVCDPACGSGHFLLAAARRIGRELAFAASGDVEPDATATRHGVREAIQHCVYGVDLNPLAVDLCKVALWLEAHEPGKPIGFLDHHIRQGNALVGATEALMQKGIPTDAFKDVTGDDKKFAGEIRKRNTTERKGQLSFWSEPTALDADSVGTYWSTMDEADDDLAGVQAKARAYASHRRQRDYWRRQLRADLWTAAFFWPLKLGEPAPPTDAYWNRLCADPNLVDYIGGNRAVDLRAKPESHTVRLARRLSRDNHFFHWELEFEDVFAGDDPGFDVILGNPPFMGGLKISLHHGPRYRKFLVHAFAPAIGNADLCAYFLRHMYRIGNHRSRLGMVATNTIGQGDTKQTALEYLVHAHAATIAYARRFVEWPGDASVEVNLLAISHLQSTGALTLDLQEVSYISPELTVSPHFEARPLTANAGKSFQGSIVLGKGFVVSNQIAESLIAADARNRDCLFPYLTGEDINSRPDHTPSRWVIQFDERTETEARTYPLLWSILEERVYLERASKDAIKYPRMVNEWWKHWNNRKDLYVIASRLPRVLARSRVSDHHMLAFVDVNTVYSDAVVVFGYDTYFQFSILQSGVHDLWITANASTMRTDIRYTPTDCFLTFPLPILHDDFQTQRVAEQGQIFYDHRQAYLNEMNIGLTRLYNKIHDPAATEDAIECLRYDMQQLDFAVFEAYGWNDLSAGRSFALNLRGHQRFALDPETRQAVLERLYALNQVRYQQQR